ncbi:MAG: hypothetical protein OEX08_02660 [Candidatus Nomurabacteria bacterium]|nr:hypothetical protein [Candidatus Nomurabacteria bacterium]
MEVFVKVVNADGINDGNEGFVPEMVGVIFRVIKSVINEETYFSMTAGYAAERVAGQNGFPDKLKQCNFDTQLIFKEKNVIEISKVKE